MLIFSWCVLPMCFARLLRQTVLPLPFCPMIKEGLELSNLLILFTNSPNDNKFPAFGWNWAVNPCCGTNSPFWTSMPVFICEWKSFPHPCPGGMDWIGLFSRFLTEASFNFLMKPVTYLSEIKNKVSLLKNDTLASLGNSKSELIYHL